MVAFTSINTGQHLQIRRQQRTEVGDEKKIEIRNEASLFFFYHCESFPTDGVY